MSHWNSEHRLRIWPGPPALEPHTCLIVPCALLPDLCPRQPVLRLRSDGRRASREGQRILSAADGPRPALFTFAQLALRNETDKGHGRPHGWTTHLPPPRQDAPASPPAPSPRIRVCLGAIPSRLTDMPLFRVFEAGRQRQTRDLCLRSAVKRRASGGSARRGVGGGGGSGAAAPPRAAARGTRGGGSGTRPRRSVASSETSLVQGCAGAWLDTRGCLHQQSRGLSDSLARRVLEGAPGRRHRHHGQAPDP